MSNVIAATTPLQVPYTSQRPDANAGLYAKKLLLEIKPSDVVATVESIATLTPQDSSVKTWIVSSLIAYFLACTYLYGVLEAARRHVAWEAALVVGLPLTAYVYFVTADKASTAPKRTGELIFIESSYNVLVVLSKLSIAYFDGWGNGALFWAFAAFFALQTCGFVRSELDDRKPLSALRSLTLFFHICVQWYAVRQRALDDSAAQVVDADGRFLTFGSEAPLNIKLHYLFWLLGVLYVDYRAMMRNAAIPAMHLASVTVAIFSGEFWHARLLTASHLFVLDAVLYFRENATIIETTFCRMPADVVPSYDRLVPLIGLVSAVGCVVSLAASLVCGTHYAFCFANDVSCVVL